MKKPPAKSKPSKRSELPKDWREFFATMGKLGGKKAAARLSPEERLARARKAAQARWKRRKD